MPHFVRRLAAALLFRRVSRDLTRIADTLQRQTQLLSRLADRFAPQLPTESSADRATVRAETGVTHLDALDASLALDYIAKTAAATGHTPDDEEVLIYLADEKTLDLAARLSTRDADLARLLESRR